jgi:hypothetical protein
MSTSIQSQIELIKQLTAELQNISIYIDRLTEAEQRSVDYQYLKTVVKEHCEVSCIVRTQIYCLPVPVLEREPVLRNSVQLEENLIADGEWRGFSPSSLMDIVTELDDEYDNILPPPMLTRQMTNDYLNDPMPEITRQYSLYPSQFFGSMSSELDNDLSIIGDEDLLPTTLVRELNDDSAPPIQPPLTSQLSARLPLFGVQDYSRTT